MAVTLQGTTLVGEAVEWLLASDSLTHWFEHVCFVSGP